MVDTRTQSGGFNGNSPSDEIAQRTVAAVGIDKQNTAKALVGEAGGDIEAIVDKMLHFNRDGAREVHVVIVKSIVDRRNGDE